MDCVVALNKVIHEVKRNKQSGLIFRVGFKKAYDKVNLHFLYNMVEKKGFEEIWYD